MIADWRAVTVTRMKVSQGEEEVGNKSSCALTVSR